MNKKLGLKIVDEVLDKIRYSLDNPDPDRKSSNDEIKVYTMYHTAVKMAIPIKDVEHAVEAYRKSELFWNYSDKKMNMNLTSLRS